MDEGVITSQHWQVLLRAIVSDAAACTFLHEGRIADLRCKGELVLQECLVLTFALKRIATFAHFVT